MQKELDCLVDSIQLLHRKEKDASSRCFIRPSGTEEVVRVYAEASTQTEVDALIAGAESLITKYLS